MYRSTFPAGKDFYGTFHWVSSCSQPEPAVSKLATDLDDRPSSGCQVVCCHGTHNGCRLACLGIFSSHPLPPLLLTGCLRLGMDVGWGGERGSAGGYRVFPLIFWKANSVSV